MEEERERMQSGRVSDRELERDRENISQSNIVNERHFNGFHWQPKWPKKAFHAILGSFDQRLCTHVCQSGLTQQGHLSERYFLPSLHEISRLWFSPLATLIKL